MIRVSTWGGNLAFPITDDIYQTLLSFLVAAAAAALLHSPAGTLLVDRH
jgi:hypothetical protein